ncbi:hypothetical protein JYK17_17250 [Streptomyces sp. KC 17012]|jgi:hypothetical protein|uniref:hypothetical protein n=1 Tax=Streptomyces plumbidurans TaxID=2814589 RepID=UPI001C9DFF22|nr:hypothetical protein [Streptomyces plumbidurans]MBY8341779.1 hypothetical protein [Streptomyces plumbidurans]
MAVDQLPGRVREFANYLNDLLARLDQRGGWCAVFWQRDPDGMRACLDGREVPPWDVVEALLHDFATVYGPRAATGEQERARPLHAAAMSAYDDRPGGREALGDRLDAMLREQRLAAERQAQLGRRLAAAATRQEADTLRLDLAWAHDDHERATARCAELRSRMAELDTRLRARTPPRTPEPERQLRPTAPIEPVLTRTAPIKPAPTRTAPVEPTPTPRSTAPEPPVTPEPEPPAPVDAPPPAPARRKRRRGSARFAGLADEEAAPVVVPPGATPVPSDRGADGRTPRGARFAGAAEAPDGPEPQVEAVDADGVREVAGVVDRLVRLRAEGRSGEAHVLLAEAAQWPPARLPLLADALWNAGLGADWATLLWETVSLPVERLVAVADALAAAGRGGDGEQILRQGVARPADETGRAVLALAAEGRHREVRALLDAYVHVRTPEEAARSAGPDPQILVPLLLEAARGVSEERHWDLVHALRVAGLAP